MRAEGVCLDRRSGQANGPKGSGLYFARAVSGASYVELSEARKGEGEAKPEVLAKKRRIARLPASECNVRHSPSF